MVRGPSTYQMMWWGSFSILAPSTLWHIILSHMCIYMCIHIYICVYIYIYMCVYVFNYTYVYNYTYIHNYILYVYVAMICHGLSSEFPCSAPATWWSSGHISAALPHRAATTRGPLGPSQSERAAEGPTPWWQILYACGNDNDRWHKMCTLWWTNIAMENHHS